MLNSTALLVHASCMHALLACLFAEEMSNEQFEHYVYDLDYDPLGEASSVPGAAARLGAPRLP